ncbi:MAG: PAS domain S-box protein [Candidatus Omnitrophica bacterium]|nr:PAS domain S-box protein [Candidatus Omnitrophota bacterium]MCA9415966.1 PAS domain S-box protein [Candidatus Omnitrophota bacterium]MCA9433181.1 PAS domain S-box protein [Candidatus Omnitrophota bacterium]MCB9784042.1 PAS domain S-box protein [Candidatus Omnitrophota bacterium]
MSDPARPPNADERTRLFRAENLLENPEILFLIFEYAPDSILLVDAAGRIAKANVQVEQMFGYSREELVGELVEVLIPRRFADRHVGYRTGYINSPRMRPMGAGVDLYGRRKDDSEFPVDIMLSPLEMESSALVLAVIRDATERKRIEAEALRAREMYLKEVHHRVKNNLQVISSLLFLQASHTEDPAVLSILTESRNRVKSIALIHEKLYRTGDLGEIDFGDYVRDLVSDLLRTYRIDHERIRVSTHAEPVGINIDTAIPCGLIINELVSNAFKHAFKPGEEGNLQIELVAEGEDEYLLTVEDDGIGMGAEVNWEEGGSVGLRLVKDLTQQLEGYVECEMNGGTRFKVHFRRLHYRERE